MLAERPEILACLRDHPPEEEGLSRLSKTQRRRIHRLLSVESDGSVGGEGLEE
jgi:hypothetical protein